MYFYPSLSATDKENNEMMFYTYDHSNQDSQMRSKHKLLGNMERKNLLQQIQCKSTWYWKICKTQV